MTDVASKLQALADTCAPRAWRLACSMMRNAAEADDVLQTSFVVAAQKPQAIPGDDAWPWFAAVIANTARNARRKRARHAAGGISLEPADLQATDPLAAAAQAQLAAAVRRELAQLPQDEADAISLTQLSGLSLRQAAAALEVPAPTLNSRLERGLDRLRKRLKVEGAALSLALPLVKFDPPPLGLERTAQGWLKTALVHASLASSGAAAATGGIGMMKLLVVAALVVAAGVGGWQWLSQVTPTRKAQDNQIAAGGDSHDRESAPRANSGRHDAGTIGGGGGAPAKSAPEKEGKTAAPKAVAAGPAKFSVSGRCMEFRAEGAGHDARYSFTEPIADAVVSIRRVSQQCLPTTGKADGRIHIQEDPEKYHAVSGADGSWTIIDIPRDWDGPVPEKGDKPYLEQIEVRMQHEMYFCGARTLVSSLLFSVSFENDKPKFLAARNAYVWTPPDCVAADGTLRLGAIKGVTLGGLVLDPRGAPLSNAIVQIASDEGRSAKTDANGHYRISGLCPSVKGYVRVNDVSAAPFEAAVEFAAAGEQEFNIQLVRAGEIHALFTPHAAAPSGRTLVVRLDHDSLKPEEARWMDMPKDGKVDFLGLRPTGKYRIRVEREENENKATLIVTVWIDPNVDGAPLLLQEPEPAQLRVNLGGQCFAEGRDEMIAVVCPIEWFVFGVMSTLYSLGKRSAPMAWIKKEEGSRTFLYYPDAMSRRVRIIALPPKAERDNMYLEFRDGGEDALSLADLPDDIFISDELELEAGKTTDVTVNELLVPCVISGRIANPRGGTVWLEPGKRDFSHDGKSYGSDAPDADGKFTFRYYLWPGEYVVRWSKDGSAKGEVRKTVTVKAGESVQVDIDLPPETPEEK
ncbi:MAG: sigma-70 family RNA polymerase sigma factor [Planctomycetes bacterium]|nr:sigma-70 family RNA polymerase sigma factor [Planctomycetota bacterium]